MATTNPAPREMRLLLQTIAAATAQAATMPTGKLDLGPVPSGFFEGRKDRVAGYLTSVLQGLEAEIRANRTPPPTPLPAMLARRAVENGEVYEPAARTYRPGPGFTALIEAVYLEASAQYERALSTEGNTR